jgi:hypothetical protein
MGVGTWCCPGKNSWRLGCPVGYGNPNTTWHLGKPECHMAHGQPHPCSCQTQTPPWAWVLAKNLVVFGRPEVGPGGVHAYLQVGQAPATPKPKLGLDESTPTPSELRHVYTQLGAPSHAHTQLGAGHVHAQLQVRSGCVLVWNQASTSNPKMGEKASTPNPKLGLDASAPNHMC